MNNVHGPPPETSTVQEYYAIVQKVFPLGRCSTNLQECRDTLTLVLPVVLHVIGSSFASWVSVCVCVCVLGSVSGKRSRLCNALRHVFCAQGRTIKLMFIFFYIFVGMYRGLCICRRTHTHTHTAVLTEDAGKYYTAS